MADVATTSSKVIALDGPAASGKGTLGQKLAAHYGYAYLDTGILYRGVAWLVIDAGRDPADDAFAAEIASGFKIALIDGAPIRDPSIGAASSIVASNGDVRAALLEFQRDFAANPPGGEEGAVLDGRDIGTVVCPDACVKFFVNAAADVRAHRRWMQVREKRPDLSEAKVLEDILERDARDAARADAPMKQAEDAELLDTTHLSIEAAFVAARRIIDDAFSRCGR